MQRVWLKVYSTMVLLWLVHSRVILCKLATKTSVFFQEHQSPTICFRPSWLLVSVRRMQGISVHRRGCPGRTWSRNTHLVYTCPRGLDSTFQLILPWQWSDTYSNFDFNRLRKNDHCSKSNRYAGSHTHKIDCDLWRSINVSFSCWRSGKRLLS